MKLANEVELVQNSALCSFILWTFVDEFYGESKNVRGPALPFILPVLPMVIHRETVENFGRRQYVGGLHLALAENKTLTLDLQERMEMSLELTFSALNLCFASKLLNYNPDRGQLIPTNRKSGFHFPGSDVREMLNTARRLGFWFSNINAEQLCSMLRIHF